MIKISKKQDSDSEEKSQEETSPSESIKGVLNRARRVLLEPAAIAAKLNYLMETDETLKELYKEFPFKFYQAAAEILETHPKLINKPTIFAGLLKKRLSHAGLDPTEMATIIEKTKSEKIRDLRDIV
jgi:hypothetical protein